MQTLSEELKGYLQGMTPSAKAKYLLPKVESMAQACEDRRAASEALRMPAHADMAEFDKCVLELVLESLRALEVEQWRQREAIKHYLAGNADRAFLRRISESWNGDKP